MDGPGTMLTRDVPVGRCRVVSPFAVAGLRGFLRSGPLAAVLLGRRVPPLERASLRGSPRPLLAGAVGLLRMRRIPWPGSVHDSGRGARAGGNYARLAE